MSMDSAAVRIANARLWSAHPELRGRQLTNEAADGPLAREWRRYYDDAVLASAPPPAVVPVAVPPPAPPPVFIPCSAAVAVKVTKCGDMAAHAQQGDIVLRGEAGDPESDFISTVSGCPYSHSGIVARNSAGELVVVDAFPGRRNATRGDVAEQSVSDFFCKSRPPATHGIITRPKDCAAAKKAAEWAIKQTKEKDYHFDLWDPWNNDPKKLYCADFVYQSFSNAGVDLVPMKTDLLDAAHRHITIAAVRKKELLASAASDATIESKLRNKTGGSAEYITPCQMGINAGTDAVATLETAPIGGGGLFKKDST